MKESLKLYLSRIAHLTQTEIETVISCFAERRIKKNSFFLKKGEICKNLAFLVNGTLRIINESDEIESTVQLVFKNTFATSLTSFAFETPSFWSIQAITDCDLLVIDRENHFRLINEYKHWLEVDNYLLLMAYNDLEYRVFSMHNLSSGQRYLKLMSQNPEIFNQIPLKYIASSIGIAPETLSRLRKKHLK